MKKKSFLNSKNTMRICVTLDKELMWWVNEEKRKNSNFNLSKLLNNYLRGYKKRWQKMKTI